ncbi:HGL046Wp [Eremothecium sinecaudum]|uniref:Probable electron transfer flavoprotein subunit alpha n=1 Tax=Eremothecium sinecaudum TaxID=45286 RepID=A0A0X8HVK6_9SACH|nr:HGL046Wp [Eremothecium sinecaudum]AMD22294.1 HGL046Wp [Eremothecium sinecaudum]
MFRLAAYNCKTVPVFSRYGSGRFGSTLTFVEATKDGKVTPSSLSALNASSLLGNDITALIVGSNAPSAVNSLKELDCPQLKTIMVAKNAAFDNYLPENLTPLCANLLKQSGYSHFVAAASAVGKNLLPRVGAMCDIQPINDVVQIKDKKTFVRPVYAGNVLLTVEDSQEKKIISIRSSSFPAAATGANSASVEDIPEFEASNIDVKWEGANLLQSERPELGSAKRIVSGGRGLKNKETFEKLITPLADACNAAIGATRAAVDAGFCDNSLQIGQTGKVVAPELYIGLGVSGAIQHMAGMKDSKVIVAINKDPEAPIFQYADFGMVGDLNEIVPELTEKLQKV